MNRWFSNRAKKSSLVGAVTVALACLAACSAAGGSSTSSGTTGKSSNSPQYGGTMNVVMNAAPTGLDPQITSTISTVFPMQSVYDGLVRLDPVDTSKIDPDLASSWNISPDGLTYTFTLTSRKIKWQDGRPFGMDDVIASLQKMGVPTSAAEGATLTMGATFQNVASFKALSSSKLQIKLKTPDADLLYEFAQGYAAIEPKHIIDGGGNLNDKAVGTGPYEVKSYNPGSSLVLVRYKGYNTTGHKPYLDEINFSIITDRSAYLNALATGRADTMGLSGPELLTGDEASQLKSENPNIQIVASPGPNERAMFLNTKVAPFSNALLRQAAFLAICRPSAIKEFAPKGGLLPGIVPPGWGLSQAQLAKIPGFGGNCAQNLTKAKNLLKQAGYSSGGPAVRLTERTEPTMQQPAEFAAQQLQAAGFKVTQVPVDDSVFNQRGQAGDFQALVFGPGEYLPVGALSRFYAAGGALSWTGETGPAATTLWTQALATTDQAERMKIYQQIETDWYTKLYAVSPLYSFTPYVAVSSRVHGYHLEPTAAGGPLDYVWVS